VRASASCLIVLSLSTFISPPLQGQASLAASPTYEIGGIAFAVNRRLQELYLDNAKIPFDEPVSLGCLLSTPDSAAFGTITHISASSASTPQSGLTKIISVLYIRAANRVLFAHIYADFKDKSTVLWLRKTSEDWASQIVTSNKN
jgi:hypothetical protein